MSGSSGMRAHHLQRRPLAARQRSMNRSPVPFHVRVFAGEKKPVVDRKDHALRRIAGARGRIAVRTASIFVGLPIVRMPAHEPIFESLRRQLEYFRQSGETFVSYREWIGAR